MIDETNNESSNQLNFATISPSALLPEQEAPAFVADYYIQVYEKTHGVPVDMDSIFAAIKAANLKAISDKERDPGYEPRENIVNIRECDTAAVVAVINELGYRTDEDPADDNDEDYEDYDDDDESW